MSKKFNESEQNITIQSLLCVQARDCCGYYNQECWGQEDPFTGEITCVDPYFCQIPNA
ncbi:hypothetical protein GCM10008986_35110 [Salinibacillus aidingensis]|uniref:Uncharacterized protein n=1 Tax=Salinibacillus aidingensis TaxID=237684 RepID=A0ABP3LTU7_9BACI